MNAKLLIGIIAVIIVALITGTILNSPDILSLANHLMIWIPLAAWICLVWLVWKKRTGIFHNQLAPDSAERHLKWLKAFLLVAGVSGAMSSASVLWGIVILGETEEAGASFFLPFSLVMLCVVGVVGSLVIFINGRRKPA